jgi:hypothetical protein
MTETTTESEDTGDIVCVKGRVGKLAGSKILTVFEASVSSYGEFIVYKKERRLIYSRPFT